MRLRQLKEHLLQVMAGGSPMSPGVARQVVQAFQRLAQRPALAQPLTGHHLQEVLLELAQAHRA
ncbi:MAG: hypothetical protein EOO59_12930 [Hymenobacter sp.]|nr:MAG: hypothetical protein EOO59_12930 [Hymenobacter sp.]